MIAAIFEVEPHADQKQQYLDLEYSLRVQLEEIDGFISVERFQNQTPEDSMLSHDSRLKQES